ncbi:uncharacterized protein LOC143445398 [Clavelina lepadiformis]|uniref:uncharacterized protein LOC143445398 n=1 Tax=Clavelina lepadiformis TaxID=159417 RepID=UPI0040438B92
MDGKSRQHEDMNGSSEDGGKKNICRDFLRNVCHRGRRCKFKHPSPEELEESVDVSGSDVNYEFCHDFQNNQCQRSNCRFIHCTSEEEENYVATNRLPLRLKYQHDFGIGDYYLGHDKVRIENNLRSLEANGRPVCRDFLNRDCHRGKKCKFLHVDHQQMALLAAEAELVSEAQQESGIKRPRMLLEELEAYNDNGDFCHLHSTTEAGGHLQVPKPLEEENRSLKKRVQELEKQVSDLAATNEVLLEQNAQFRLQKRGAQNYGLSSEAMGTSYAPAGVLNTPAIAVASNAPRPVPVQLNVQVAGQPQAQPQDIMNSAPAQAQQRAVVASAQRLQQVPVSGPHTTEIAQVIASNFAANTGGNVEIIPGSNQVVSGLSAPMTNPNPHARPNPNPQLAQPNINQMAQQPIASFSAPVQSHNQMVQQPMASFSAPIQSHNPMAAQQQQAASFAGTIMAAALAGGRCAIQTATNTIAVTLSGDVRQPTIGSMGPGVPLPQPALVYTVTRSTENMPLVSTLVSATGHEMALVPDAGRNAVSSMPASLHVNHAGQAYNNVSPASQALVQAPSHQSNEIVPVAAPLPCAPMTSCIGAANTSMPPPVSLGGVRPVVQNNHAPAPRVNTAQRTVVQAGSQMNEQTLLTYPISAVPQAQMHN